MRIDCGVPFGDFIRQCDNRRRFVSRNVENVAGIPLNCVVGTIAGKIVAPGIDGQIRLHFRPKDPWAPTDD